MRLGIGAPQGHRHEFAGWDPAEAWEHTVATVRFAERLGVESIWLYDHMHPTPPAPATPSWEPLTALTALACVTSRVRLGHLVLCAGYRNPAMVAKAFSTLDYVSRGRVELGLGAGWKQDEWVGYGFGFPSVRVRLEILEDALEIVTRMMREDLAHHEGRHHRVEGAINAPKPRQQPRIPVIVGGNGPEVTWRLAARFADELNLNGLLPHEVASALPVVAARCEEAGRDPASLRVSIHLWGATMEGAGSERADRLGRYRELGLTRAIGQIRERAPAQAAIESFVADAREAGIAIDEEDE